MTEQPDLTPDEQQLATAAGNLLRQSADELDAATLSRLNRARQAAVAGLGPAGTRRGWLLPAYSTAAVAMLVVAVWVGRAVGPAPTSAQMSAQTAAEAPDSPVVAQDLDVLLAGENPEMMEDLEFYAWLDPELSNAELQAELETAG
jgi:hypothetical protein